MTTSVQAAPENAPKQFGLGVRMRGFSVHQSLKSQARQSGNIVLNQSSLSQNLTNMDDPLEEAVPRSFSGGWGWACTGCGVNLGFVGWLGYRLKLRGMSVLFGKWTARHLIQGSGFGRNESYFI